jgi:hypothetical protein
VPTLGLMARGSEYESEQDLLIAAGYVGTTVGIFAGPVVSAATYPIAAGATLGLVVGAGVSGAVWGEEGLEDFAKFYTGEGNYMTSDPQGSGYFNVPQNVETIVRHQVKPHGDKWEGKYSHPSGRGPGLFNPIVRTADVLFRYVF